MNKQSNRVEKLWSLLSRLNDEYIEEAQLFLDPNASAVEGTLTLVDHGYGIVIPASKLQANKRMKKFKTTFAGLSSIFAYLYLLKKMKSAKR